MTLVVARDLKQTYKVKQGWLRDAAQLHAVGGISFELAAGRTLAVVGESGCGKSTLARMVTLIEKPTAGALTLDGVDAVNPPAGTAKTLRRTVQIVFQNPHERLAELRPLPRGRRTGNRRSFDRTFPAAATRGGRNGGLIHDLPGKLQ